MSKKQGSENNEKKEKNASRLLDVIVVVLCLCGFGASLYLFQNDLFRTLRSISIQSVGIVTVKHNTVQRRMADRVVWDRLGAQSPIYPGDLIRIARQSGALLNINNNYVELGENTLIRIQKDSDTYQIDFFLGSICITSEQDCGSFVLTIADQKIETAPGAAFYAAFDNDGMILQVNEGSVQVIHDGYIQSMRAGDVIIHDNEGNDRLEPMVFVAYPRPNMRYLKTQAQSEPVNFYWNRINMDPQEGLRLEVAGDYNFTKIAQVMDGLDSNAAVSVDSGNIYWRLSSHDAVLSSGRLTVTEAVPPVLLSPAMETNYYFKTAWPKVYFRWSEVDDVMYYNLQISQSQDFYNSITAQVYGTSYLGPELGPGRWYWKVQPVYPSVYEGAIISSKISVFNISQSRELQMPALVIPASDSMINIGADRTDISFSWSSLPEAVSYTIQISADHYLRNPVITKTVNNNYYVYGKNENILTAGNYYWSVFYSDKTGNSSPLPPARQFTAVERVINQRLAFPPDNYIIEDGLAQNIRFSWITNLLYEKRFQVSALPDFSILVIDERVTEDTYQGISIPSGNWYWRISARYDALSPVYSAAARRFTLTQPMPLPEPLPLQAEPPRQTVQTISPPRHVVQTPPPQRAVQPASQQIRIQAPPAVRAQEPVREPEPINKPESLPAREPDAAPVSEPEPASVREPEPSRLTLYSPPQNAVISGLAAITQPTVFNWDTSDIIGSSKFILSRQPNLTQNEVEILNPGRTVTVNSLEEGLWYWTVEAQTQEGVPFITGGPHRLHVQPIPLLPAPQNIQPVRGYRIGANELRQQRTINFAWSSVNDANKYILTISIETDSGPRRVFQTEPLNTLNYTFNNLELLEHNAVYVWQIEALLYNSTGAIIQRGQAGESFFILDVPRPGQVQTTDTGVLYGF